MVPALDDDEGVAYEILAGDEPWGSHPVLPPADAEAAALPERVARQPLMLANDLTVGGFDRSRNAWEPGFQELTEWSLTDEADAGGIGLVENRQAALAGDGAHLRLAE